MAKKNIEGKKLLPSHNTSVIITVPRIEGKSVRYRQEYAVYSYEVYAKHLSNKNIKIFINLKLYKYLLIYKEETMERLKNNIKVVYGNENLREILTMLLEQVFVTEIKNEKNKTS